MVIRRCPQCHTTTDDQYGFCIKCGYEFPKLEVGQKSCPLCGYPNPDEADFCVKCGTPLIFKSQFEADHTNIKPIVINKTPTTGENNVPRTSRILIVLGYLFSILGGLIGLIIASLVNLLLKSSMLEWIISLISVAVFTGLTAYDTQKMFKIARNSDDSEIFQKAAIMGALELYLDFINIFLSLLNLFGKRKS